MDDGNCLELFDVRIITTGQLFDFDITLLQRGDNATGF